MLSLLPTAAVGSPGTTGKRGKRKVRSFVVPHIPHDDVVLPEEVQGIRAFGSEGELAALSDVLAQHLQSMRDNSAGKPNWTPRRGTRRVRARDGPNHHSAGVPNGTHRRCARRAAARDGPNHNSAGKPNWTPRKGARRVRAMDGPNHNSAGKPNWTPRRGTRRVRARDGPNHHSAGVPNGTHRRCARRAAARDGHRHKHAITLEWLRMGALKGEILDADGSTIYNLFDEFGISPSTIDFALDSDTTDIKAKCLALKRTVEDNLRGELMSAIHGRPPAGAPAVRPKRLSCRFVMTGIHVLVSPEFFDAFTGHPAVIRAYERWQEGEALRSDMRSGFTIRQDSRMGRAPGAPAG